MQNNKRFLLATVLVGAVFSLDVSAMFGCINHAGGLMSSSKEIRLDLDLLSSEVKNNGPNGGSTVSGVRSDQSKHDLPKIAADHHIAPSSRDPAEKGLGLRDPAGKDRTGIAIKAVVAAGSPQIVRQGKGSEEVTNRSVGGIEKIKRDGAIKPIKKTRLTVDNRFQVGQIVAQIMQDRHAQALRPRVLELAILAYQRSAKMGIKPSKPVITLIDYSLPSIQKRLWVIDLQKRKILYCSLVAHGKNSGKNRYARAFSNRNGSLMSSLGVFMTEDTYFGRDGYSLRLQGLERGINDNAKKRYIVMHGSPYVSEQIAAKTGRVGCSWGCPAVEPQLAKPIINTIKGGSLIFSFYPDHNWLKHSPFLHG